MLHPFFPLLISHISLVIFKHKSSVFLTAWKWNDWVKGNTSVILRKWYPCLFSAGFSKAWELNRRYLCVSPDSPYLATHHYSEPTLFFLLISQWESSWNHVSLLRNTRYSLLPMECWGLLVSQGWRWYIFSHSPKVLQFSSWEGRSKGQRDPRLTRQRGEPCVSSFSLSQRGKRLPPNSLFSLLSCILLSFANLITRISCWIPGILLDAGVMPQVRPGTVSWGSWF